MTTWSSASRGSAHPRTPPRRPGGDPPGPPGRRTFWTPWRTPTKWTPWRRTTGRGRTPLDRADPAEALLEDPLGDPDNPPGNGDPDTTWRWIVYLRRRVQLLELEVDTGKSEMARISHGRRARAQKDLDIARGRDQVADQRRQRPAGEAGRAGSPRERRKRPTHPWSLARRTTAGDPDQVQADPTPPAELPGVAPVPVPPLSPPPLTTARAAATSACRPAVAVRNAVMSGSARSTATAVLHRGHRYAPGAPHHHLGPPPGPGCQSQRPEDVMVDSGTRSPEKTWSGMSVKVRTWTWTWRSSTSARRVVYDGRPLNSAVGAVMKKRTWKEYGVNILVQRT